MPTWAELAERHAKRGDVLCAVESPTDAVNLWIDAYADAVNDLRACASELEKANDRLRDIDEKLA